MCRKYFFAVVVVAISDMDFDENNSEELEAELYSRIHHDQPDANAIDIAVEPLITVQSIRTVTKHSVVNNSNTRMYNKKTSTPKNRKKITEKCNPNPFAIASAMNNQIPKRLTPYTSYLSQVDSQPIDLPSVEVNENQENGKEIEQTLDERRPNPFNPLNKGFNRSEEKMKRKALMQAKKAHQIRKNIEQTKQVAIENEKVAEKQNEIANAIPVDSESGDEVYIYPPEEPTLISSDEDETNVAVEKEPSPEQIDNLHDDGNDIDVDYDKRLSRHDDPFGGIDVAHLNTIISEHLPPKNLAPIDESSDHFAKPHSKKQSYHVSETDFAATDVYESESSDLPENNVSKGRKIETVLSESERETEHPTKRSKRMRKRKSSGSNRGSDCISSDDSDDDGEAYLEPPPEKSMRPFYLHRGEGVVNAVTKYSKRLANRRNEQNRDISLDANDSSEDSMNDDEQEHAEQVKREMGENETWIVTDEVGKTDDVALEFSNLEERLDADKNVHENDGTGNVPKTKIIVERSESNADKDDDNSVRSKRRLVIHPEMGWNNEMKAFYNDSWGGETNNAQAIRSAMPSKSSSKIKSFLVYFSNNNKKTFFYLEDRFEWRLDPSDLRTPFNPLKNVKCHNCRENGHRMAFCPQPKKEMVCYTCGNGGHRECRCPYAICLKVN